MPPLDDADVLALWERGIGLHPLDRALLLAAYAHGEPVPMRVGHLPVGVVNLALMRLRRASFGPLVRARIDCAHCNEELEVLFDTDALLCSDAEPQVDAEAQVGGCRLRAPTVRDLAAIAGEPDAHTAALALLERCCTASPDAAVASLAPSLEEAETQLAALDPAADIALAVTCEACGRVSEASLDIGAVLWDELAARAASLLADVHRLALAYGWREQDILAMSAQRRAVYLDLASP